MCKRVRCQALLVIGNGVSLSMHPAAMAASGLMTARARGTRARPRKGVARMRAGAYVAFARALHAAHAHARGDAPPNDDNAPGRGTARRAHVLTNGTRPAAPGGTTLGVRNGVAAILGGGAGALRGASGGGASFESRAGATQDG